MPTFEYFVEMIRGQLWGMQTAATPAETEVDIAWLRTIYDYESEQPLAFRRNELQIAQAWEQERQKRNEAAAT